ncbi:MAG: DeoR/GlpR transcriptional regulator [Tabrizicola sp.]|nr:DeoR/GlpR transcriptional regulator [Tabrizicola sp.]
MSQTHRERLIIERLTGSGAARIADLARDLAVSEETIRRTLKKLEQLGTVSRVHGGVHLKDWGPEPNFALRLGLNPGPKRVIARRMAEIIKNGASLFLDVGSTTAYVADALRNHRDLLVVTNSLPVAQTLAGRGSNRVFMAGGELRAHDGGHSAPRRCPSCVSSASAMPCCQPPPSMRKPASCCRICARRNSAARSSIAPMRRSSLPMQRNSTAARRSASPIQRRSAGW